MKMKIKKKNKSHDAKYKKFPGMMVLVCSFGKPIDPH